MPDGFNEFRNSTVKFMKIPQLFGYLIELCTIAALMACGTNARHCLHQKESFSLQMA